MSRSETFHAKDYSTLTVENEAGDEVAVAGLQGVTITPNCTVDQLYTADSNKIADQVQYEFAVNVEIEFIFFDGDIAKEWLGGNGSSDSSWADDSNPELFQIADFTGESRDGSNELTCTVDNVTFEEMPLAEWSDGEYYSWNLSGTGEDISDFDVTAPA